MADPITISISLYVADKIVGKLISDSGSSAIKQFFFPAKTYKNRLAKIIQETIDEFEVKYPAHNSVGNFRFYYSKELFEKLSKHILFKTEYDTKAFNLNLNENPNIIPSTDDELADFFITFIDKVNQDNKLKKLHIDENYKNEIFEISSKLNSSLKILAEIRDYLIDSDSEKIKDIFKSNTPLDRLIKKTTPLDLEVLRLIRKVNEEPSRIERNYQIYHEGLNSKNKSFKNSVIKIINDKAFEVLPEQPEMIIDVLPKEEIQYNIHQYNLKLTKPRLLWDCNCKIDFPQKYNIKPCPIHDKIKDPIIYNQFSDCFSKSLVQINASGLNIFWNNNKNLWPPSMDSIYLVEDLKANSYDSKNLNRVIDIGCGTGYLGIWLAKFNRYIKEVQFTDWMLLPLVFSYFNKEFNKIDNCNCVFNLGLNTNWLLDETENNKFDLAICNPPYLPLISGRENFSYEMTVAGTELLTSFILNWKNISSEAIISFSDIAMPEAIEACKVSNSKLIPIGKKRNVPFRVNAAYTEKNYIPNLIRQKRIQFRKNSFYPYWHKVQSYRLENSVANNV